MRLALSVIALLLVAYLVLSLTKKQAEVLVTRPRASGPVAASAATLPQQVRQDVQKALEQGLQQRASAPGP